MAFPSARMLLASSVLVHPCVAAVFPWMLCTPARTLPVSCTHIESPALLLPTGNSMAQVSFSYFDLSFGLRSHIKLSMKCLTSAEVVLIPISVFENDLGKTATYSLGALDGYAIQLSLARVFTLEVFLWIACSLKNMLKLEPNERTESHTSAILRSLALTPAHTLLSQLPPVSWVPIALNITLATVQSGAVVIDVGDFCSVWSMVLSGSVTQRLSAEPSSPTRQHFTHDGVNTSVVTPQLLPGDSFGHAALLKKPFKHDHDGCKVCGRRSDACCVYQ